MNDWNIISSWVVGAEDPDKIKHNMELGEHNLRLLGQDNLSMTTAKKKI